jgi:hypothetical protein
MLFTFFGVKIPLKRHALKKKSTAKSNKSKKFTGRSMKRLFFPSFSYTFSISWLKFSSKPGGFPEKENKSVEIN